MGRPWSPVALSGGANLTLDVIVEHAVLVPVFVEQAEGIGIGKIFKLDEAIYSKPVGREREELMIASLCPVPGRSQPALGSREAQDRRYWGWHGSCAGVVATSLAPGLLGSAYPIMMRMGKGESGNTGPGGPLSPYPCI